MMNKVKYMAPEGKIRTKTWKDKKVSGANSSLSDLLINIHSTSEAICTLQHNSSVITKPKKTTQSTSCTSINFACEASKYIK